MLKVFLVEDEIVVRQGISRKIDWNGNGFEFAGEASDGELALPLIQETRPDIIITDIKMPFMDGLTLSRKVRQEFPWTKIIILSGYDEFHFAQEAINIGVTEYLLKPVTSTKILETLLKVKEVIQEEQAQKRLQEQYRSEMQENVDYQRKLFFTQLVTNAFTIPDLLEKAKNLEVDLDAANYNVILFESSLIQEENKDVYSDDSAAMNEKILQTFQKNSRTILFHRGLEGWALLLKGTEALSSAQLTERTVSELENLFQTDPKMDYFIGVGMPVERIQQISQSYNEANRAFAYRYIFGGNRTVYYDRVPKSTHGPTSNLSLNHFNPAPFDRVVIDRFLRSGLPEGIPQFIEDYSTNIGADQTDSLLLRQFIVMTFAFYAASFLDEIDIGKKGLIDRCGDLDSMTRHLSSYELLTAQLTRILETTLDLRNQLSKQKFIHLISKAETYIQENFQSDSISLNTVAQQVNVSPAYFSSIFSQEKGITFIEYLTNVRIEHAKDLLRSSSLRSSEISQMVGYKDSHYFSFIFKKVTGMTPKDFRAGKLEN